MYILMMRNGRDHDTNAMCMYVVCIARYYLSVYAKRGKITQNVWNLIIISNELWSYYWALISLYIQMRKMIGRPKARNNQDFN